MKSSKLINTLKTFSKEEMNMFGKFLASPFHNNGKNCTPLFKQLQKHYPDFKTDKITYETLYKKLYPGKKFNKQVMWNLVSAMEKMTREFLAQITLRKNKFANFELMLSEFSSRKLLINYSQTLGEMEKLLELSSIEYEYFDKKGHLENYKREYYFLTDKVQFMGDSTLKTAESYALLFLRMTVGGLRDLKILEEYHNYRIDVNIPLEFAKNLDLKSIVDYANKKNYKNAFIIEIYYHSFMMLIEPQKTLHLDKFRELYELHYKKFTMSEQKNLMHWLINYCLYNHDLDENKFRKIVFELNDFRLREGMAFHPENQLPKAAYLQILINALDVNETEWVENFIKKYTIKLLPAFRDSVRCLAYAFLYFHTKEYHKVLKNLNKIEFIDVQDKINTRALSAKSYYELDEMETLLHYIDSSKHFLINNPSVSEIFRIYSHNFFQYLKKIVFIRENKDTEGICILRNEIEKNMEISQKKWLLEKLNELEKDMKK
jgi:hypothetical protein